jgi:hypothetical protein
MPRCTARGSERQQGSHRHGGSTDPDHSHPNMLHPCAAPRNHRPPRSARPDVDPVGSWVVGDVLVRRPRCNRSSVGWELARRPEELTQVWMLPTALQRHEA